MKYFLIFVLSFFFISNVYAFDVDFLNSTSTNLSNFVGNVSIASTSNSNLLSLYGLSSNQSVLGLFNNTLGVQIQMRDSGSYTYNLRVNNGQFSILRGSNQRFLITDDGNVLIGSPSGSYKLNVAGSINGSSIYVNGVLLSTYISSIINSEMATTTKMISTGNFGLAIIITLLFIVVLGFMFNNMDIKAKFKKW